MSMVQGNPTSLRLPHIGGANGSAAASDLPPWVGNAAPPAAADAVIRLLPLRVAAIEFVAVCVISYLATAAYNLAVFHTLPLAGSYAVASLIIALLVTSVAAVCRQFEKIHTQLRLKLMWSGLGAVALAFSFFLSMIFFTKYADLYSRGTFIAQFVSVGTTILAVRAAVYAWLQRAMAAGALRVRRLVLIGDTADCARFAARMRDPSSRVVTVLPPPSARNPRGNIRGSAMVDLCRAQNADDIIILSSSPTLRRSAALAYDLSELPVGVHIVDMDAIDILATANIVPFGNIFTMQLYHRPLSSIDHFIKRAVDVAGAMAALILLMPLLLIVAVLIKLDSRGPVLFRQSRHGYNNDVIRVLKFRTMTTMEDGENFTQAVRNDPRVTRVGRILRKTNIDELPQLINVLTGEMSLVGPRPHATAQSSAFATQLSRFSCRHRVKPGITGWAQVNGYRGPTETVEKMQRRLEHDLYYIENWSLLLDLEIMVMTLFSRTAYTNAC